MAVQPKKKKSTSTSKTTIKKKPITKKKVPKRRKRKSNKKGNGKRNILLFLSLLMMLMFVGVGFYLGKNSDEIASAIERGEIEGDYTTKQLLDDLLKVKKAKEGKHVVEQKKHLKKPAKESLKTHVTKVKKSAKKIKPPVKKRVNKVTKSSRNIVLPTYNKRPKLAIIIDDVSKQSQMNAIMQTGLKITPSIFPPSELSMTSNHLADRLKHYMIHLPMESGSKQFNSQYKTLLTRFSRKQIEERVKELRRFFPNAHFINNHTGSVFTNDYNAMFRLYTALRKEGFIFMDSRTIGSSKVKRIASKFGDPYVSRDIFIDNIHTVPYIHKQLRKAVNVAKKKGYAIAIGHTHHITMQALSSANDILKDVELIYIDELYKER